MVSGKGPDWLGVVVVSGRVIRFDGARGYGFIAPDQGGEDVFLHVNDMLIPESYVRQGLAVEFEIDEGDRGPKASSVRLAAGAEVPKLSPPPAAFVTRPSDLPRHDEDGDPLCDVLTGEEYTRELTEVLLEAVPSLTGGQIVQIRASVLQFAKSHGWTEG